MPTELEALASVRLSLAPTPDDVWDANPFHVDGLHDPAVRAVLDGLTEARESHGANPLGVVIRGQRGTGKTHLMGWLRDRVQLDGGYFFLLDLLDPAQFWPSMVSSMLNGLARKVRRREPQVRTLLRRLSLAGGLESEHVAPVLGDAVLTRDALDAFLRAVQRVDDQVARECQSTIRALVLYASGDLSVYDIGQSVLQSHEEEEDGERRTWGIRRGIRTPKEVVSDLSRLLALTGPTVIAIDQIDQLLAPLLHISDAAHTEGHARGRVGLDQFAEGLMTLRERTQRTLTVLSCLHTSWALIESEAVDTAQDRFRRAPDLQKIPSSELGRALVARRLADGFKEAGFVPPHPTWPVATAAFDDANDYTARELLKVVDEHIRSCLTRGTVIELDWLDETVDDRTTADEITQSRADELDQRFVALQRSADAGAALEPPTEDAAMPPLINAGLQAWILQGGNTEKLYSFDPPPGARPALHARLRKTLDDATEREAHCAFRAISSTNANAALTRLKNAVTMSGLEHDRSGRHLVVLRNSDWSKGPKTQAAVALFKEYGGRTVDVSANDIRVLSALRTLLEEGPNHLQAWLQLRKPASAVRFLQVGLEEMTGHDGPANVEPANVEQRPADREPSPRAELSSAPALIVGKSIDNGALVSVELEALRKHTAIFAGSGSGKTVLIRRLVEECALQGVSSIVLDPNNDLARLGDGWPTAPSGWGDGDAEKASDYLAHTDVVVWTPRRQAGRALSFQPLPDFASVRDDPDEFDAAIDAAVATLAPRARVDGNATRAVRGRAVLTEALQYFARSGFSTLREFIGVLAAFPEDASRLENAEKIAADLAQDLNAAVVNDPLFGGTGTPVDPGVLLTPAPGKRARVSVISLVGLPSDEQRQSFVNQLQMALFAWVKKNPAGDRPLGGLFVMDEAQTLAPSGAMTACTQSTLALASQARKYGLGLVFATQAPKGLHNRIPGNAATQFFGLLNSPVQISAAQEMAKAKGGAVPDVGRMRTGEFYAAPEGSHFVKVKTPLCLSYHPKSPLTTEEVVERASNRA
ncbi:ATP-binding protein [Cryptosporangium phraense]|nr:DUF87 domain-containing protein [Cryptosporangium phraense]